MRRHQQRVNKPRDEKQRAEQTIVLFALDNEPPCAMHQIIVLSLQSDSFYRSKRCGKTKMRLLQTHAKGTGTTIKIELEKRIANIYFCFFYKSNVNIKSCSNEIVSGCWLFFQLLDHVTPTHRKIINAKSSNILVFAGFGQTCWYFACFTSFC